MCWAYYLCIHVAQSESVKPCRYVGITGKTSMQLGANYIVCAVFSKGKKSFLAYQTGSCLTCASLYVCGHNMHPNQANYF